MTPSLSPLIEALIFASPTPLTANEILKIFQETKSVSTDAPAAETNDEGVTENSSEALSSDEKTENTEPSSETNSPVVTRAEVQQVLDALIQEYSENTNRGFFLANIAQGYQFRTRPEHAPYVKALLKAPPTRLSQAALESLAMVAYRQPITRAEIDQIRGVDSGGVIKTLLERNLIKMVGKKEEAGRPMLYGTTPEFLEVFSLKNLQELPTLKDLAQIEEEMRANAPAENRVRLEDGAEEAPDTGLEKLFTSFETLEKEEEEAFRALEEELKQMKAFEEQAVQSIVPPAETAPIIETEG